MSMGVASCEVAGTILGSCTNASVDMQIDTVPIHAEKVGSAYIVGSKFAVKGISGSLSVTTEEVGSVRGILDKMLSVLKGEVPVKQPFSCTFPIAGGSLSGQVLMLPQFSASASADGWSSITIQPMICDVLGGSAGSVTVNTIGGVPFLDTSTNKGAITVDTNNLCRGVECDGIGVGFLSVSASCQFTPIYRNKSPWPVDYVVDSAKVSADIGFYDFSTLSAYFEEEASVSVKFLTVGGNGLTLDFGTSCIKALSGMRTSAGVNTWHLKVEGNAF